MNNDNKISMKEVHERLNARVGTEVSQQHFEVLHSCWKKKKGYKSRGDDGWLRVTDAEDFLKYAY